VIRQAATRSVYCNSGGCLYKGIWERILSHEVEIELLQSILKGDEICQVRIIFAVFSFLKLRIGTILMRF
jgi:hypothetical protein